MKTITALLIGISLALAGLAFAQQPETQESPAKKGGRAEKTTQPTETKPTRNAPGETKPTRTTTGMEKTTPEPGGKQRGAKGERAAKSPPPTGAEASPGAETTTGETAGKKGKRGGATTKTTAETGASASPGATAPTEAGKKGRKGKEAATKAPISATPAATAARSATPAAPAATRAAPATSAPPATSATAGAGATGGTGTTAMTKEQGTVGRGGKKVEQQQVQQIKQQHASFKAQPKPNVAPAVTFNANFRISGAERWRGPQYEVFRAYHPEWHDRGWYHSRFGRVELIGGGYYYFSNGYWYPAWGYDTAVAYYPYDGPIYVGHRVEPPDRVIADVQAELQDMGYYTGEVDGLLGPLTRQALRDYQEDHGLEITEAIDEPTLDALQLS